MKTINHYHFYFHDDATARRVVQIQTELTALHTLAKGIKMDAVQLNAKVDALEAAATATNAAIAAGVAELDALKAALLAAIAAGNDGAALQAIADRIDVISAGLSGSTTALVDAETRDAP